MRQKLLKKKNSLKGLNSRYKWAEKNSELKNWSTEISLQNRKKKNTKINQNFRDLWDSPSSIQI